MWEALKAAGRYILDSSLPDGPLARQARLAKLDQVTLGIAGALAGLADLEHVVRPVTGPGRSLFASGQIIRRDDAHTGVLYGGSDPRKDGLVAAF